MSARAVIAIANLKGGSGKSTVAVNLSTELAEHAETILIDADPNKPITTWMKQGQRVPDGLKIFTSTSEKDILGAIDRAADEADFVIIDLEGVGSRRVSYALSRADLVLIPMQEQKLDVDMAGRVIEEIQLEEARDRRKIPYVGIMTRTRVVAKSRTARIMGEQITQSGVLPVLNSEMNERDAFAAVWAYGVPLRELDPSAVNNIPAAVKNVAMICEEVIQYLVATNSADDVERFVA